MGNGHSVLPDRTWSPSRKVRRFLVHNRLTIQSATKPRDPADLAGVTKFAVLMARERGRIGSDAALGDMPKRLQAHSYDEMNEGPAR